MSKKEKDLDEARQASNTEQQEAPAAGPTMTEEEATTDTVTVEDVEPDDSEEAEVADMMKKLEQTEAQLNEKSMSYLRLAADFDNYRKRVTKEKADIIKNAAEKVLAGLLPIVDDFERGLEATKDSAAADDVRQGMELIYHKLLTYLASYGVTPIESTGADFDADLHDAIATVPAPDESKKGKVIDTTTKGYKLNDKVLRHAKVVVGE